MNHDILADPARTRNLSQRTLPGSLGDLIARTEGKPIYCTGTGQVRRALVGIVIDTFRRDFPDTVLINALAHYGHSDDRRARWSHECDECGALIVVTRGDNVPQGADPFVPLAGEHVINTWVDLEITHFVRRGRPVAWHAIVFPAAHWYSRFRVVPFEFMMTARWARLLPSDLADTFRPIVGPCPISRGFIGHPESVIRAIRT